MTRHHTQAILLGALLSCAAWAPQAHGQDAHEHGVSHLDVVLDGSVLAIDLRGAGHHLAGFEHAPETPEQHAAWQAARDRLGDAAALFPLPPEANCSLQSADVIAPPLAVAGSPGHDEGDADSHGHDHGHHHDHGHGHGQDHAHHQPDHDHAHGADWRARYRFECADAARLTAIEVGLFTVFPAHEEVRYQRFSDSGQGGGTLTPERTRLELR